MHFKKITTKDNVGTMTNVYALYRGIRDQRVQWYIKILALLIVAYVVSPIDLIPDFIPVLGYLDDLIILPLAIAATVSIIPAGLMAELRHEADTQIGKTQPQSRAAAAVIVVIWAVAAALAFRVIGAWLTAR